MTLHIAYFHRTEELALMVDFINWQRHDPKLDLPASLCMEASGGGGIPCVYLDEKLVAVGFFALVDWLRKEGFIQI